MKAADVEASKWVGGTADTTWSADNKRTTTWDFTAIASADDTPSSNQILQTGDFLRGIKAVVGGKGVDYLSKNKNVLSFNRAGYFSVLYDGTLAIPLQAETTSVDVTIQCNNNTSSRAVVIGNGTNARKVYLTNGAEDDKKDEASLSKDSPYTYTGTFDVATYKSTIDNKAWLQLSVIASDSNTGEAKIEKISIVETKSASSTPTKPVVSGGDVSNGDVSDGDVSDGDVYGGDGDDDGLIKPGKVGDKTWEFNASKAGAEAAVKIEGDKGKYAGLAIDATAAGAKFEVRNQQWAIFSKGAIIKVPVDGACEITVVGYTGSEYTVNGEAGKETQTFTYQGKAGYVNVVAGSGNYYIDSISVKHIAAEEYLEEGNYVFFVSDVGGTDLGKSEENVKAIKGLTLEGTFGDFGNHGFKATSADAAFVLNLSDSATIVITTCCYGQGNVTSTSGTVTSVDVGEEGKSGKEYTIKGASGKTTVSLGAGAYIHSISVTYNKNITLDTTKPDVWDFGAMEVKGANNLLTVDIINGLYPEGTKAGDTNVTISSFEAKDSNGVVAIKFVTDKSNHRIRTTNKAITRYDDKSKNGANNTTYDGFLYSNNTSTADSVANSLNRVSAEAGRADHLDIYLYEGDTLTCMLGSNSNPANYKLYDPDSAEFAEFDFTNTYGVEEAVFHAAGEGWYQLYCTDEKLVCARITREHAPMVTVSGSIDVSKADGIPDGYGVIYTNVETGKKTEMEVADGKYTGIVPGGYSYKVTLKDANGYVVRGGKDLKVGTDKEAVENNLTIETVDQKTISGKVTGLTDAELTKVKFVFEIPEGYVFEPQITLTGDSSTLKVEEGISYKVTPL
ncbi:MAG: hypothetical protein K2K10_13660, partial [Acetatifactor sp.]|nr:hypothetical protein [Acetatifactor sp.]